MIGPGDPDAGHEEVLPLDFAQSGILFDLLRRDAPVGAYCGYVKATLHGPLDVDRLATALRETARTRDVFRLSFEWEGLKRPLQILQPEAELPVAVEDWAGRDPRETEARLRAEQARGFDLRVAPLSRALILRHGPERHDLVWFLHHLIADGWSTNLLLEDVMARYRGQEPPTGGGFRDVLAWRATGSAGPPASAEAFYREYLAGIEPTVRPSVGLRNGEGPRVAVEARSVPVDPVLDRSVRDLARQLRVTPSVVLSTLFAVQLRRYGVGDDVLFGETNSGRPDALPGSGAVVGPFVNTLPVRLRIDPTESVAELVGRANADAMARRPFRLTALSDVMAWSGLRTGAPLYRVPFVYEGLPPMIGESGSGLSVGAVEVRASSSDPMALLYLPGENPSVRIEVDPRFHDPDAAEALAREYVSLVAAAVKAPDQPVVGLTRQLSPFPPPEPVAESAFAPVHLRFREWAEKAPDAPAVRCGDERISYRALLERSDAFAAGLAEAGIGPGDIVPVAMGRSVDAIAAMLGVLFRGAAYVILDLSYPQARLRACIEAVAPSAILSRPQDEPALSWCDLPRIHAASGPHKPSAVTQDMTAYVLFTSGSQGRPKGVRVTHGNLAYSTAVRREVYGGDPRSFLVLSPLGFDSSVAGIYWALTTGGEVQLSAPGIERDVDALSRDLEEHRASHMLCLPGLYQALLDRVPAHRLSALDTVIVAGEALSGALVARHAAVGHGRLFNEYGPTEATVWCTVFDTADHDGGADVPIGRAIPGSAIAITDPDGAPLPDGTLGEITVAGAGVAAGYIGDGTATSRAFGRVSAGKGELATYRTGDLGIRRPDGVVLYRGRADAQLKVRGHRVELSEVEAKLADLPGLGEVAVLGETGPTGTRLVAFAESGAPAEIRDALLGSLPGYMVPSSIHILPDMPRLPNGKIDRRALAELRPPSTAAPDAEPVSGFVAKQLARIWAKVLGLEDVRSDDDFFLLGGDSLSAMRVVFEAEAIGLPMAPHEIFDHPVLSNLAGHIQAKAAQGPADPDASMLARLNAGGGGPPFLMIHGSPEMCAHLGHALGPDRPLLFRYSGFLRGEPPWHESVDAMADELARLALAESAGRRVLLGGYSLGGVIAIEVARRVRDAGGGDPFVFLVDPSWETGGSPLGGLRRPLLRWRSVLLGRSFDLGRKLGIGDVERLRLSAVRHCYRAMLLSYLPRPYPGPVQLLTSADGRSLLSPDGWLPSTCANRVDLHIDARHLELQKERDALFQWTSLLVRALRLDEEQTL
jgi:amino acid adenylation domain-containing protein